MTDTPRKPEPAQPIHVERRWDGSVVRTFDDTPAGWDAIRRHLLATFGPKIEWRVQGFGIEVRKAEEKPHADPA